MTVVNAVTPAFDRILSLSASDAVAIRGAASLCVGIKCLDLHGEAVDESVHANVAVDKRLRTPFPMRTRHLRQQRTPPPPAQCVRR